MFAVIVFISVISLLLMGLVNLLERAATPWKHAKISKHLCSQER